MWAAFAVLLRLALELFKEWRAKKESADGRVKDSQAKQIDLLNALNKGDDGYISRLARDRALRLRILLSELPPDGNQPANGGKDVLPK